MTSTPTFRALHIGDLHFWQVPLNPLRYFNKRLLGVANLVVGGRARKFRQELAPALVEQCRALSPDAYFFSGDFSSTALLGELHAGRDAFLPLVQKASLGAFTVPGNHDCYLGARDESRRFQQALGDAFRPSAFVEAHPLPGGALLLAINATTANGLGSHGSLIPDHVQAIKAALAAHSGAGPVLLLCHFPAEDPKQLLPHDRGPQLHGADALLHALRTCERPMVWLHGHHHSRWLYRSPSVPGLNYLNAGAPLLRRKGEAEPDLGFHELHFRPDGLNIVVHRRVEGVWGTLEVPKPWPEVLDLQKEYDFHLDGSL